MRKGLGVTSPWDYKFASVNNEFPHHCKHQTPSPHEVGGVWAQKKLILTAAGTHA